MLFFGSPAQTALRISKILTLPWARMDNPASGLMMEHPAAPVAARLVLVRSGMIISAKRLSIGLTGLSSVIGLKLTASHGLGGSNFIDTGGAIVDPGGAATMVLIDGGTASISAITLANTYIETHNGETGEIVHINNGRNINLDGVFFNRGGATASNCISIQGTNAGQVRAYGRASGGGTPVCTTLIDNTITGYTLAPTGDFDYYYPGSAGSGMVIDAPIHAGAGFTFANIGTNLVNNGDFGYCSNCTITNPCAGGGTGAIAKRLNGINVCN